MIEIFRQYANWSSAAMKGYPILRENMTKLTDIGIIHSNLFILIAVFS